MIDYPIMVDNCLPLLLHDGESGLGLNDGFFFNLFQKVCALLLLSVVRAILVQLVVFFALVLGRHSAVDFLVLKFCDYYIFYGDASLTSLHGPNT